jgi:hypothetical protein
MLETWRLFEIVEKRDRPGGSFTSSSSGNGCIRVIKPWQTGLFWSGTPSGFKVSKVMSIRE